MESRLWPPSGWWWRTLTLRSYPSTVNDRCDGPCRIPFAFWDSRNFISIMKIANSNSPLKMNAFSYRARWRCAHYRFHASLASTINFEMTHVTRLPKEQTWKWHIKNHWNNSIGMGPNWQMQKTRKIQWKKKKILREKEDMRAPSTLYLCDGLWRMWTICIWCVCVRRCRIPRTSMPEQCKNKGIPLRSSSSSRKPFPNDRKDLILWFHASEAARRAQFMRF